MAKNVTTASRRQFKFELSYVNEQDTTIDYDKSFHTLPGLLAFVRKNHDKEKITSFQVIWVKING